MGRVTVPAVSEIATEVETEDGSQGREEGRRRKGIIVFPIDRKNEFTSLPLSTRNSPASTRRREVFLLSCHFFFLFFFSSRHLPCFRFSPRCLAHWLAQPFYHHRRFPLLRLLCRFVSAFCDELIKPDRYYRPEILTRGSRRPEGGKGTIWNVVFMKTWRI